MAIAIAILRYRLYEIDRIISRTIAWAVISGVLVGAFVTFVIGLQATVAEVIGGETLAVAMSTLAACALFQPVRSRVQHAVDRRFDRARYDARRTADAFSERLRDSVDLEALAGELQRDRRRRDPSDYRRDLAGEPLAPAGLTAASHLVGSSRGTVPAGTPARSGAQSPDASDTAGRHRPRACPWRLP